MDYVLHGRSKFSTVNDVLKVAFEQKEPASIPFIKPNSLTIPKERIVLDLIVNLQYRKQDAALQQSAA